MPLRIVHHECVNLWHIVSLCKKTHWCVASEMPKFPGIRTQVEKQQLKACSKTSWEKNKPMLNPNSYAIITALEPFHGTLSWNFGTFRNLTFAWNPLLEPSLGTLTWNLRTSWNLGTLEPSGSLTWNLGTFQDLYSGTHILEWILYLEPLLETLEPSGTFTWKPFLGPRNLYLKLLLGTSEPRRTLRDDCPRVPQGLVWLRPRFQLLGKKSTQNKRPNSSPLDFQKTESEMQNRHPETPTHSTAPLANKAESHQASATQQHPWQKGSLLFWSS